MYLQYIQFGATSLAKKANTGSTVVYILNVLSFHSDICIFMILIIIRVYFFPHNKFEYLFIYFFFFSGFASLFSRFFLSASGQPGLLYIFYSMKYQKCSIAMKRYVRRVYHIFRRFLIL